MASRRPTEVGTKFETAVCRYMRGALGDGRIERRAKHGSHDMGDIYGLVCHGFAGIVECKCHERVTGSQLMKWRRQTVAERGNADADFALLVVRRLGCNYEDHTARRFGMHDVHVQVRDLMRVAAIRPGIAAFPAAFDQWVTLPLAECCALMLGGAWSKDNQQEVLR